MFAGALLNDGTVLLEDGMEVEGVYWESDDRLIIIQSLKVLKKLIQNIMWKRQVKTQHYLNQPSLP
jgi:hypothetical protein